MITIMKRAASVTCPVTCGDRGLLQVRPGDVIQCLYPTGVQIKHVIVYVLVLSSTPRTCLAKRSSQRSSKSPSSRQVTIPASSLPVCSTTGRSLSCAHTDALCEGALCCTYVMLYFASLVSFSNADARLTHGAMTRECATS
jgi:hypothetical protein